MVDLRIEYHIRAQYVRVLRFHSHLSATAIRALINLGENKQTHAHVRSAAIAALGYQDGLDEEVTRLLLAIAMDPIEDDHVREDAYEAIKQHTD